MSEGREGPNRERATRWNDAGGKVWVEMNRVLDAGLAPLLEPVLDAALPSSPDRLDGTTNVLDIGCGAGATTLAAARRVSPLGRVLGADISGTLLRAARARAQAEGVTNVDFVEADAQTHPFPAAAFDAALSRLGVMFFADPVAAFANIRRGMREGARLAFVAWRTPEENPFMTVAGEAAASLLPNLPAYAIDAPGAFGLADATRTKGILERAGFRDIAIDPLDAPSSVAEEDLMSYATKVGPVGLALHNADDVTRARVTEALRPAFAPFVKDGAARYTACVWLVRARA
jgi:ubiquinone/menaquinone biosynthesis C-methylase UbiE